MSQESMEHLRQQNPPNSSLCQCRISQGSGFDRFLTRIGALSSSNGTLHCQECIKKEVGKSFKKKKNVIFGAEFLWVCLECEQIFCGVESLGRPDGHIHYHAITNHHPAAIQIAAWCFECKAIHRITTREVIEVRGEPSEMEQGDFDGVHGGYVVKPMQNLGNSCFFNAVLQNLLSMDVLRAEFADLYCQGHSIAQDLWSLFLYTSDFAEGHGVMVGHAELFASICSRVPNFSGHQQQDSHELLRYLLGELVAEGAKFIEDIFGGRLSSTISCVQCGNASESYESFLDLSLAIPSNESPTKKGKVVASKDLVLPAKDISSCPPEVDCCGRKPCACTEELNKTAEPPESQRKDHMVEVEEDPEDCCGQNPCICNKALDGIAESLESQWNDQTVEEEEEEEEDPEDCCCGMNPCICNIDLDDFAEYAFGLAEFAKNLREGQTRGREGDNPKAVVEDQIAKVKDQIAILKSTEQDDNLDSDDKYQSVKLDVNSRKRPTCASSFKFEDEIQSGDPLSIEKCLDFFTSPEILSGKYACDHCSSRSRDRTQTQLQSSCKNDKFVEGNEFGGCGVTDGAKPSEDEGVDIGSRKAKMDTSKRYLIFQAPRILTIHLKRFAQDNSGITKKIKSHVNIREILDLTPYMDPSCEDRENSRYFLIGVVQHLGVHLMGGHYVAYVRGVRRQGDSEHAWFRASDLDVRGVSLNEVLNGHAYILFYERM